MNRRNCLPKKVSLQLTKKRTHLKQVFCKFIFALSWWYIVFDIKSSGIRFSFRPPLSRQLSFISDLQGQPEPDAAHPGKLGRSNSSCWIESKEWFRSAAQCVAALPAFLPLTIPTFSCLIASLNSQTARASATAGCKEEPARRSVSRPVCTSVCPSSGCHCHWICVSLVFKKLREKEKEIEKFTGSDWVCLCLAPACLPPYVCSWLSLMLSVCLCLGGCFPGVWCSSAAARSTPRLRITSYTQGRRTRPSTSSTTTPPEYLQFARWGTARVRVGSVVVVSVHDSMQMGHRLN